jgi:zinc protease
MVSSEVVNKASLATVEKYWRNLFADAAGATMVFVGDIDVDALKPLVEKYIGSLPAGKEATKWVDQKENVVKGRVENVFAVDMQTPKSTVYQIWSADMEHTYEIDAALEAISYILDIRYTNSLREEEGGTYGASSSAQFSRRPTPSVLLLVGFDCKPALCDKLRELAINGLKDLAQNGPTDDELNSAKLNLQKNLPESRQRNAWWRNSIQLHETYGEDRDAAYEAAINALDKDIVVKTLQAILAQDNFIEVVMKPANTAEAE